LFNGTSIQCYLFCYGNGFDVTNPFFKNILALIIQGYFFDPPFKWRANLNDGLKKGAKQFRTF
jgi:hypothetical protein